MRAARFQPFSSSPRASSLHRLKTAFSPTPSTSSYVSSNRRSYADSTPRSAPSSCSSTGTASPLESDCGSAFGIIGKSSQEFSSPVIMGLDSIASRTEAPMGLGISRVSKGPERMGARQKLRALLLRRRSLFVSKWDVRVEEEIEFGQRACNLFEPTRKGEVAISSIFEVLETGRW